MSNPHHNPTRQSAERRSTTPASERGGTELLTKEETKTRRPRRFAVVFHNDDFTSMEFVVWALVHLFEQSVEQATQLMLEVHQHGAAKVGAYPREVAETKREETMQLAEQQGMPLLVTIEPTEREG